MESQMKVLVAALAAWETSKAVLVKATLDVTVAANEATATWTAAHVRIEETYYAQEAAWAAEAGLGASEEMVAAAEAAKAAVQAARAREEAAWGTYYDADSRRTTAQGALESAQAEETAAARVVAQAAAALVWEAPCGRKSAHEAGACECHGYHP